MPAGWPCWRIAASSGAMIAGLAVMAVGLGLFNPAFQTLSSRPDQ